MDTLEEAAIRATALHALQPAVHGEGEEIEPCRSKP
jgi:hypothetical protein